MKKAAHTKVSSMEKLGEGSEFSLGHRQLQELNHRSTTDISNTISPMVSVRSSMIKVISILGNGSTESRKVEANTTIRMKTPYMTASGTTTNNTVQASFSKKDPDFPVNQKESEDDVVDLYSTIFEGTFDRFRIVGKGKITTYRRLDDFPNINDKSRPADQVEDETPLDIYEGDFYNGKLWGDGKIYFANGNKYIGEFENGKMHGKGQFYWKDGRSYVGEYVKGKKDGQGTFKWADGVEYKGGFKNGKQEGLGVLTTKEGKKNGEWRYGILWMWEEEKERQKANATSKGIPQIPGADQAQPKHGFLPFLK